MARYFKFAYNGANEIITLIITIIVNFKDKNVKKLNTTDKRWFIIYFYLYLKSLFILSPKQNTKFKLFILINLPFEFIIGIISFKTFWNINLYFLCTNNIRF
jgi:hypothetical protein